LVRSPPAARSVFHHPTKLIIACSGDDDPNDGTACGVVINRKPSSATGLMSALCSTGNRSSIARHVNAASSRSTASRSPIVSASAFSRASWLKLAASSLSLSISASIRSLPSEPPDYCCKSLFVSPITNSPGCTPGDRILIWGTTSFCDELTGDFGGAFEATSIGGCRLFCRLAEIQSHGVLGLLQHYPSENRHHPPFPKISPTPSHQISSMRDRLAIAEPLIGSWQFCEVPAGL
jgi:hypothetical protein